MSFKKVFMQGYTVYVIALIFSWFVIEPENILLPVIVLILLFGVFNIYVYFKKTNVKSGKNKVVLK